MSSAVAVYQAVGDGEDFVIIDHNHALEKIERVKKENIVGAEVSEAFPGIRKTSDFLKSCSGSGAPERRSIFP